MTFIAIASERTTTYSQISLRLVDEFVGGPSLYPVDARLSVQDAGGTWRPLERRPVPSPSGILLYPGLGRSSNVAVAPVVRHRVELTSEFYRPDFLRTVDALEFDVHPYDDSQPPAVLPTLPYTVLLLPSVSYPHAARTVRGRTLDVNGDPVANVEVMQGTVERVLSDERGAFTLPLRWVAISGPVVLDAIDHRTGRTGQITVTLPQDLQPGHSFTLT